MNFDINLFLYTLPVMGKGMAGIFIVTAAVILCMKIMTAADKSEKKGS